MVCRSRTLRIIFIKMEREKIIKGYIKKKILKLID